MIAPYQVLQHLRLVFNTTLVEEGRALGFVVHGRTFYPYRRKVHLSGISKNFRGTRLIQNLNRAELKKHKPHIEAMGGKVISQDSC